MGKFIIAVHGGASESSPFLKKNEKNVKACLTQAVNEAYHLLEQGNSALDAVEMAVKILEDNPLFNAGRGSALNCNGKVEMDASIMNGRTLAAGAICMVTCVKNPISLARLVMEKTAHVLLSGYGALEFAEQEKIALEAEDYFIAEHQVDELQALKHGTVGAVALDKAGNLAAATSTGGTCKSLPGRVGDSCIIGAGCYANNKSCAVSGTGEGEYLIRGVVANTIALMVERNMSIEEASKHVIFERNPLGGEMGVISVDSKGDLGISFNTEIMKRAWKSSDGLFDVKI
ncbi:MAG: isoaspartyl peptidase/L-asparaginase [Legionella sp.]|nr:isoaspartyl peptidase/L-asparaginase [Legionella sp.]